MKASTAFIAGFFAFFGLCDAPYKKEAKKQFTMSVSEALHNDWQKVKSDFSRSFERLTSKVDNVKKS